MVVLEPREPATAQRRGRGPRRLGLLLCNDLGVALRVMRDDQLPLSKLSLAERIETLVLFSISDEYFQLRRELGIALGSQ